MNNIVKIEKSVTVRAYVKRNQITFILDIPLTDNVIYNYFKLYSFPIFNISYNKTLAIVPKYPYFLVKGLKYLSAAHSCEPIDDGEYLCTDDDIVPDSEETCVEQLMKMRENLTNCIAHPVDIEDKKIQRVKYNTWLIYLKTEKCGDEISHSSLHGSYILKMEENCEITLDNIHIVHHRVYSNKTRYRVTPLITLPVLQTSAVAENVSLDMREVNFDDLKHLAYMLKVKSQNSVSENDDNQSSVKVNSISLASLLLYVIVTICVLGYCLYKSRIRLFLATRNYRNQESSGNSALGEGGVMLPLHTPRVVSVNA